MISLPRSENFKAIRYNSRFTYFCPVALYTEGYNLSIYTKQDIDIAKQNSTLMVNLVKMSHFYK